MIDAMMGQEAVTTAKVFNENVNFDGVVLTKLDGDARGGSALSIATIVKKPIKFIGIGEKLDEFEEFHPQRIASRILDMGDIVSLVEKAAEMVTQDEAGLFLAAAVYGLGFGGIVPAYVLAVRELFPAVEVNWRVPALLMCSLAGMAFGAWLAVVFALAFLTFFGVPFISTSPHKGAV